MKFQLFYSLRREKIVIFMMNKIKGDCNFPWRGREISNSDCTKSAFNKSRMEVNFHIQLLVGRCTLASAKGFFTGVKTILKSQYPFAILHESS